ncbi:hypothetical protein EYR40_009380 [Pleurotus pulmonarius]|nr:hypothetical protein EYR40_009380 [Pleurotus pulmonarius]
MAGYPPKSQSRRPKRLVDFDGFRALQPLFDAARDAGIFIVLRPGPYINAETTAGGIAHWATSEVAGNLRTGDADWKAAWQAYIQGIINVTVPNQITEGGPVIEFQGGSFDAWGPTSPGYAPCRTLTGADFQSVFNLQLWASNAKLINYYMFYGGTSWGAIPFHGVYTSYDYGASIQESRQLTSKFDELKRQGLFLRSSPELFKTDWVGDTTTGATSTTSAAAFATLLRNPDTESGFYILRQADVTSTTVVNFKLNALTSAGNILVPSVASAITLDGRQSKVVVTDYAWGSSRLLYSTAQIFFAGTIDGRDVLFLFGDSTQEHELVLTLSGTPRGTKPPSSTVRFTKSLSSRTTISFLSGIEKLITVWDSDKQLVLFSDTATAATFWAPTIAGKASDPLKNFWQIGTDVAILVGGPHLVRTASISGSRLDLKGDLSNSVTLSVIAPRNIRSITWNGERVDADVQASSQLSFRGGFVSSLKGSTAGIKIPQLKGWKFSDSLPEIRSGFSDQKWVVANHMSTNIPYQPYYGDGRILYGCDYGFCENIVLWRGHFNATGDEKSVNLSINGGEGALSLVYEDSALSGSLAFAASVWLNNVFLNTSYGNSTNNQNILEETDDKFTFPPGALFKGDNVLTIVQDNMGLNESRGADTSSSKGPRGVRGFQLDTGNFTEWRVQGKVGGYTEFPDKVRGVMNEGGLFGERQGWHLPGFDTSTWKARDLASGLPGTAAGVGFFVTTFDLSIPRGFDVFLSFTFNEPLGQPYRALLFVNGWHMGKRVGNLG